MTTTPQPSEADREVCVGCGHEIALHYNDVKGIARCLWEYRGVSTRGVIGLPFTQTCDCKNFESKARLTLSDPLRAWEQQP